MAGFTWTDEAVSDLRKMYAKGMSDREMAEALSAKHGSYLTRNATIGKRNRLGLCEKGPPRPAVATRRNVLPPVVTIRQNVPALEHSEKISNHHRKAVDRINDRRDDLIERPPSERFNLDVPGYVCEGVTIYALTSNNCHWPLDAGGFCGNGVVKGPYCETHRWVSRRKY